MTDDSNSFETSEKVSSTKKITKKQLIKVIDDLKKRPNDRIRILGDVGISVVGAGLGAAAASTVAGALGITSIAGVTTVASWVGVTAVSATPIGWVIGAAAVGAGAAYGVSRIIHGGGLSEGRKSELLQQYKQEIRNMEAKENAESITQEDKDSFIFSLKELIAKDAIKPDEAKALIEYVENGIIPISEAFKTVYNLLDEEKIDSCL